MSAENSGWTVWVPVVAAIITASAVVGASYIGADAKRQVEALKVENESLRRELAAAQQEMKSLKRAEVTVPATTSPLVTVPASIRPASTLESAQAVAGVLTKEIDEIAVTLTRVHSSEDTLTFDFQVINKAPGDKSLNLLGKRTYFGEGSRFMAEGQEYEATSIRVGTDQREDLVRKRFVSGVPLNGQVTFKGVPRDLHSVAALELAYSHEGQRPEGVFRFLGLTVE